MTIKNNNEDEQTRYVKRYMTDGQMVFQGCGFSVS